MAYQTIWTAIGLAKRSNAELTGAMVTITHMAFGDANITNDQLQQFTPVDTMTALVNEVYRRPVDSVSLDETNQSWVNVEGHILAADGGWWVREIGLYDSAGDMVAVGSCSPRYKPVLAEGESTDQYFKLVLLTSNTAVITLKIDPAMALASRLFVSAAVIEAGRGAPVTLAVESTFTANHGTVFLAPAASTTVPYHLPSYTAVAAAKYYTCKNIGQGVARLAASDGCTIDGEATLDLLPGDRCVLVKDGTNWQTI